ncbi:hypothetical protein D9Q98_004900 [Chlorella vulgaris]|uniref:E3 ubiquitin-protein ligase HACE1 n=1 Tax=Chlorella vulgaris TaxID=3077 RepID=A0A9D4YX74_CHLVU|nr:hypothetical protein D9Q98_004900 [Chlorella vulgaris]
MSGAPPPAAWLSAHQRVQDAARAGQEEELQAALEAGGDPNQEDVVWGDPPLLSAARSGHAGCCATLLAYRANANVQASSTGLTAAMVAVKLGSLEVLEAVLPSSDLAITTDQGLTIFHFACLGAPPSFMQRLVQHQHTQLGSRHPASDAATTAAAGRPLLLAMYAAVAVGSISSLQLLAADPLARAAHAAEFAEIQDRLMQPQSPLPQNPVNRPQPVPMDAAVQSRAAALREGALGAPFDEGREARLQQDLRFLLGMEALAGKHSSTTSFIWRSGGQPLHLAAAMDRADCCAILLDAGLGTLDAPTAEGFTPLMLAAASDAAVSAAMLIESGAALERRNCAQRTAVFLAAVSGSPAALWVLLQAGANVNAAESSRLCSPLNAAVSRAAALQAAHHSSADALLSCVEVLLEAGADVHHQACDGSTALHSAAGDGSVPCIKLLLRAGAAVDAENNAGHTPLAEAAASRVPRPHCLLFLLGSGAAVTTREMSSKMLGSLLAGVKGGHRGSSNAEPVTVWQLLSVVDADQLRALSSCSQFYDLPHTASAVHAPSLAKVDVVLELVSSGCANLLYNASAAESTAQGRRPAYLLDLLQRDSVAAIASDAGTSHGLHPAGWRSAAALCHAVATSPHVTKLIHMWASAQQLLQYLYTLMHCPGVPTRDREQLAARTGHLFSSYHSLGLLCSTLGLSLTTALHRPSTALIDTAAARAEGNAALISKEEKALAAALGPFWRVLDDVVGSINDPAQLQGWHFLLEYGQLASLGCKHRLLRNLISPWPRKRDSLLVLSTGRQNVLQRACAVVEEQQDAMGHHSMAAVLWHGIKVAFSQENAIGDGVVREWFSLLAAELTHPDTGLLETNDGGKTYSPAPHASLQSDHETSSAGMAACGGHLQKLELVGAMLGVALLQGCTLPGLGFTAATWRLALGQPPQPAADLEAADPVLHRSLQQLLALGPGVADLSLHFEVQDVFGRLVELCDGGSQLPVTDTSVQHYCDRLTWYKQVGSIAAESEALGKGLRCVLTADVTDTLARCFSHAELNAMVCGLAEIEVEEWQAHTAYQHCTATTRQLSWFWGMVTAMDQQQRRQLLAFVTSSTTLPAGGFAALRGFNGGLHPFTVCLVMVEGDTRLPRASTCFNTLYLPLYSSQAVLERRLVQAITGGQSFDEGVIQR